MKVITVEHLCKEFYTRKKRKDSKSLMERWLGQKECIKAVDDISFQVEEGECVAFLGPNGAGKSTTIKMMTGILSPSQGIVQVCENDPFRNRKQNAMNIGAVFGQRTQLWWDLPVEDSLKLLSKIYELDDANFHKNYDFFVELLDMGLFIHKPIRQLSLGQRMRADIAAAFMHNPKVVFLDEPTIGLDVVAKRRIREFIQEINREKNISIILTTHDMNEIESLVNRVIFINKGKLIFDGTLPELRSQHLNYKTVEFLLAESPEELSMVNEFGGIKGDVIWDKRNQKITYVVQKGESISKAVSQIIEYYEVKDIAIREPSMDKIVEEMYVG